MKYIITTAMLAILAATTIHAQKKDETAVKQMLATKNFIFKAQSVSPQVGGLRQLTSSDYDLSVTNDLITSWLPYFGRAYSAPIDPAEGGIKFTSSKFEYSQSKKNKHSWDITIRPKDVSDVQALYLTVFDNGSASLRVNSISRQSISFLGYITENKNAGKKAF